MMRSIHVQKIIDALEGMCQDANYTLSEDMVEALNSSRQNEKSPLGKDILEDICANMELAKKERMPICQDTGTAVIFIKIGQDVQIIGGGLTQAIHEGVRRGYEKGYLRKSIVENPLYRKNTGDNTPAIIHYDIVEGDVFEMLLAPKGGGSENMSKVYMLTPSRGIQGIKDVVKEAVELAGPNACLPVVIGVGIGGNFEKCTLLAKQALTREIGTFHADDRIRVLEEELLEEVNALGIGPQGLGGTTTALAVHIETYPCHIASMPVAINIGCHVNRHIKVSL
ncbi:MAG: fumarate hydratase [Cellulosilyticaceae bacterium]